MLTFLGYVVVAVLRIAAYTTVSRIEDITTTMSSEAVSKASSLSTRVISRIAGKLLLFCGVRPIRALLQAH